MLGDESVDSALERINAWESAMVERAERADALALRASTLSATARSRDGLVEVTVGAEGQLSQLSLDERTRQQPAEMTARTVVETLQAAKDQLVRHFEQATAETIGADNETGRALIASLRRRLGPIVEDSGGV